MTNPFEIIDSRLSNIENLLLGIKHAPPVLHTEPVEEKPVSMSQIADDYGVTRQTIQTWLREGKIHPGFMKGGRRYWYRSQLREFDLQNHVKK